MKILITGKSGQLGTQLKYNAPKKFKIYAPSRKDLDLSKPEHCFKFVENLKPDWIINSGAYTNVDLAEKEISNAMKINYEAPLYFSKALRKYGGNLLQISTDYVFNGKSKIPYEIEDKKRPINIYGMSKLMGEKAIEENLGYKNQAIILRTSWIISPFGRNFVLTILNLLKNKKNIKVVSDQIGSPTSAKDLSIVCWKIIELWEKIKFSQKMPILTLHFSNDGAASWFDVAKSIMEISNDIGLIKSPVHLEPINSCDFSSVADRPNFSVLDNRVIKNLLDLKKIYWYDSLREILLEINRLKVD